MIVDIYLRKSRADLDAEQRGEGETLSRHRATLMQLADARKLIVRNVYEELVSGDTVADRPQMQALLRDIQSGDVDGVLCMDVDRLGRGDGSDQAMILKSFKYSSTSIITPYKTYSPSESESDEEFLEFRQFFARSEYRSIKRRMWAGRCAAASEGRWQSPVAPFGYRRVRLDSTSVRSGWTLEPVPAAADAVRMIFSAYDRGECGMQIISNRLNDAGFRTSRDGKFTPSTVRQILRNPVYIGKVRWNFRRQKKTIIDGAEVVTRPRSDEVMLADGLHPAIIDAELFDRVQRKMDGNYTPHMRSDANFRDPLAGLMICPICVYHMGLTPMYGAVRYAYAYKCKTHGCPTSAANADLVYVALLEALRSWIDIAPDDSPDDFAADSARAMLSAAEANRAEKCAMLDRQRDLLERGIYSPDVYLDRSRKIEAELKALDAEIARLRAALEASSTSSDRITLIRHVLDVWSDATPREKNTLLKSIVAEIRFNKTHRCTRNEDQAKFLSLDVFPLI